MCSQWLVAVPSRKRLQIMGVVGLFAMATFVVLAACEKASCQETNSSQPPSGASSSGATSSGSSSSGLPSSGTSEDVERQYAVYGGGCFWCIEAVFERVLGVYSVESGYAGGTVPNPSYEMVSSERTGHAEVCRIEFDPRVISYEELTRIFFKSHDPTLLNAQGPDHGTRYRSIVLYTSEDQKETLARLLEEYRKKRTFRGKVVTEVAPLRAFYAAEEYHQDYFAKHPEQPYCEINIRPKIGKFERSFKEFSKIQKAKEKGKAKDKRP